jgi:hypothetical protein
MKRAKIQHINTNDTAKVILNGILSANLPIDILKMLIFDYIWTPRTHQSLVLTCKSFQSWIMSWNHSKCMFDISDATIGSYFSFLYSRNHKPIPINNKYDVNGEYKHRIPLLGCLAMVNMVQKHLEPIGNIRVLIMCRNTYDTFNSSFVITDSPLKANYLVCERLQSVLGYKPLLNNTKNTLTSYYDMCNIPNDIYKPYPAWSLLSKYTKAWTDKQLVPTLPCPEVYHSDVVKILKSMVNKHKTKGVKYSIFWRKLQLCMDISAEAYSCVCEIIKASMVDIKISHNAHDIVDLSNLVNFVSRTLDVFPEELLIELSDLHYIQKEITRKIFDMLIHKHIDNRTKPHDSIINFINAHASSMESLLRGNMVQVCKDYVKLITEKRLEWNLIPLNPVTLSQSIQLAMYEPSKYPKIISELVTNPLWDTRTSKDLTDLLLLLSKARMSPKAHLAEIEMLFSGPMMPTKITLTSEMDSKFIVLMFLGYGDYIVVDDAVIGERFTKLGYARDSLKALGYAITKWPKCISKLTSVYPIIAKHCIRYGIGCRTKKNNATNLIWNVVYVLISDTKVEFLPEYGKFRCGCCETELRTRLQLRDNK